MKPPIHKLFLALSIVLGTTRILAQGTTAFTYQGQLHDTGTNANGAYTMTFKLYDSAGGGNQVGSNISTSPTLANGLFTVNLDFGRVFDGNPRWLEITVTSGPDTQTLSPRVQVLPTPYAQFAAVAGEVTNHAIMNAQLATNSVAGTNIQNSAVNAVQLGSDPGSLSRVTAGNAVISTNGMVSMRSGLNLMQDFGTNGSSSWNILNGSTAVALGGLHSLTDNLFFSGPSGSPALQLFDSPAAGFKGLAAPNVIGGYISGDGTGITNIGGVPKGMLMFLSSGTFTVPTNITRVFVEAGGGGGGGGNGYYEEQRDENDNITNVVVQAGGGGGAGGYGVQIFTVTPGASYPVIVGQRGNEGGGNATASSFLSLVAGGGSGGGNATSSDNGAGGLGGSVTGSIIPATGNDGYKSPNTNFGGFGGSSFRGGRIGFGMPFPTDGLTPGSGGGGANINSVSESGHGGGGVVLISY